MSNFFKTCLELNDLVAAPMAGISSPPFRKLLRHYHNGLIYTEMVSVEGVMRDNILSMRFLDTMDNGDVTIYNGPTVVQLFGGNYAAYPDAAKTAEKYADFDAFDVNMGCPVKKVVKAGGGCALLQDTDKIALIVRNLRHGTDKPFSIKIRLGWDESKYIYREIADIACREGADALAVHARTKSQMFGGRVNYEALAEIVENTTIPVIGNGDVIDYESYLRIKQTGVNGVMIGRGMMHYPWIFRSLKENTDPQDYMSPEELYSILTILYEYMMNYADGVENTVYHYNNVIKKFAVWFSKGLKDSALFRQQVYKDENIHSFFKCLDYFRNYNA